MSIGFLTPICLSCDFKWEFLKLRSRLAFELKIGWKKDWGKLTECFSGYPLDG